MNLPASYLVVGSPATSELVPYINHEMFIELLVYIRSSYLFLIFLQTGEKQEHDKLHLHLS